ncbi:NADH dehydrogenase [ubiquinone] 1 alpha subcomplex subunit 8-B-like [Senna tora]|uniref:NADH dehydrogenase [ubiquinone] 1 alpha subcomplex subunit 8-B-like n=1 Tax=Senna tora TaxID=362788 RepID=A0A834TTA9_9FABA|nr:NADH dehydrogenase [ubiquinone] 1 alpha subcomplex subunit 8-B-like [Senna tora]
MEIAFMLTNVGTCTLGSTAKAFHHSPTYINTKSCSTDGTVRIWNCHTGKCADMTNAGGQVKSLISAGSWVFAALPNAIRAWNIQALVDQTLDIPKGVLSMAAANNRLYAGAADGLIYVWNNTCDPKSPFQPFLALSGHTKPVLSLTLGVHNNLLFSASMDHTIKVCTIRTSINRDRVAPRYEIAKVMSRRTLLCLNASGNPIPTSAVLMAASKQIAVGCYSENLEFLKCKKKDPNPEKCLDKGREVTRCVLHLLKDLHQKCTKEMDEYVGCMYYNTNEFEMCRKEQQAFEKACSLE